MTDTYSVPKCCDCREPLTEAEVFRRLRDKINPFDTDTQCDECADEFMKHCNCVKKEETEEHKRWKQGIIDEMTMIELKAWPLELRGHGETTDNFGKDVFQFAIDTVIKKLEEIL